MSTINGILAPLGVVILLTAVVILAYLYARRQRDSDRSVRLAGASVESDHDTSDDEDGDEGHGEFGLDEATIMSFPSLPYQEAAKAIANDDEAGDGVNSCSICLVDYKEPDMVRVLPACNHFFHFKCVDPWLKLHSTCPICRKQLITRSSSNGSRMGNDNSSDQLSSLDNRSSGFFVLSVSGNQSNGTRQVSVVE